MLTRLRVSRPVGLLRYHLYKDALLAFPRRRQCNLCGWRGRRFLAYLHPQVLCPACGSQIRHRLIAAALEHLPAVAARTRIDGARVLHFSPEYCLGLLLGPRAASYVRADFASPDCDVRLDITSMPSVPSESFDTLVACDVLEHVVEDRAALAECRRVLAPGGTAILTVPQADGDVPTLEDPSVVSPGDRAVRYGQPDHVRNYGSDFAARVATAGFDVVAVDRHAFSADLVERHVLAPPVPLQTVYGWNERRVYFARRT